MSFNRSLILIALLLSLTPSVFGQTKFGLSEYPKMVNLSDSQISPDGKSVVVVVSRPDYDKNRNNAELVMIDVNSGKKRVLTQNRSAVSSPRWSPDGTLLAFISKAGLTKESLNQIFVLSMNGGEARQVLMPSKESSILHGVQIRQTSPLQL